MPESETVCLNNNAKDKIDQTEKIGSLAVIVCPMLEDEFIHCLVNDLSEKEVFLVDNDFSGKFSSKLDINKIPIVHLNSWDDYLELKNPDKYQIVIEMNDLALHIEPSELKTYIENQVQELQYYVDGISLYYGMCGNYDWDISKWAEEQKLKPVTIFRDCNGNVCDDCIAAAVGGRDEYRALQRKYFGMFYLTPAQAVNWREYFGKDNQKYGPPELYGGNILKWLCKQAGYEYAAIVDTGLGDKEEFMSAAKEFVEINDLKLTICDKDCVTLEPTYKMYNDSKAIMQNKSD